MKKRLNVLMIEDSKDDALLIIDYLKQNGTEIRFERVETASEMESALKKSSWDIIYSDYFLPKFSGLEALKLLKMKHIEIPFLVISGKIGEEKAAEIIKAGADDYIMKDRLARLLPATEKLLQEFELRKQYKKARQEQQDSEKKFEIIFQKSMDVILIIDAVSGKILNINKTAKLLLCYESESLVGKHFSILFPDETEPAGDKLMDKVQTYGSIFECQEFLRADGSVCPMDLTATLIPWKSGKAILATFRDVSERVWVENELRLSEEKYRILVENASEAIAVAQNGMLKYVNPKAVETTGFSQKELLSKPFIELIHPEDQKLVAERYQSRLKGEEMPPKYLFRIIDKKGITKWIEINAVLINWEEKPATLNFLNDITDRKQAENALRESEKKFKQLFKNLPDAIVMTRIGGINAGEILDVNPAAEIQTGYTREELIGMNVFRDISTEETDQILVSQREKKLNEGEIIKITEKKRRKDGSEYWAEVMVTAIKYKDEKVALGVNRDITKQLHAEQALCKSEERNRTILNAIPDLMFRLDKHGTFLDYKATKADDLAVPASEFMGRKVFEVLPEKLAQQVMHYLKQALQTGNMQNFEYQLPVPLPNGEKHEFEARLVANKEDETLIIVRDITEQKHAQEKIKSSLKEKEVLLKEIHHRVKNNLQIISSLLYLQSKYLKDNEVLNIFLESQNRIRSMSLVHEKLYRSKNLAQINFSGYITDLVKSLFRSYSINVNRIKLKMDIQQAALDIDTAIPCGLILNELVTNAIKYAFPENATGEIQITLKSEKDGKLVLSVGDTGVGLPDHFNITETSPLGMRLVETLVDQIRGNMEIDKNNGTVFKILFKTKDISKDKK